MDVQKLIALATIVEAGSMTAPRSNWAILRQG